MRYPVRIASIVGLTVLVSCFLLQGPFVQAAPRSSATVTASPSAISCPLTAASASGAMRVCVSGLNAGDYVTIPVPWMGSPESVFFLSSNGTADSTGSFCVTAPPDWATLELSPGTYSINTTTYPGSDWTRPRRGPSTTFVVR